MRPNHLVPPIDDSPLALASLELERGEQRPVLEDDSDSLLYVVSGAGALRTDGERFELRPGAAGLVGTGEKATVEAGAQGLALLSATVGPGAERHAPLGGGETVVPPGDQEAERTTGSRSFRVYFGPHNGSTRATLFAGFIPPGKAPWHYHLYDEIVWVPEGPGRLHVGDTTTDLAPGSAFRLRPRQVHIVENSSPDREMAIIGIFTPAGSPSAAYLSPEIAAEYRFSG